MTMQFKKLFFSCFTVISLISSAANAEEVTFNNHSNINLFINRSAQYAIAFFPAGKTVTFNEDIFKQMCADQTDQCEFSISKDFDNKESAVVTFSGYNVVMINNQLQGISVNGSGSKVDFENSK
jgi:hypothetical protein